MKVTVGPSSNLVFQSATDRGGSPAQITVTSNTGPKVVTVSTGGGGSGAAGEAYNQANSARDTANGAYSQANGAYGQANGAYSQANGAYTQANGAYSQANGAYAQANGAYSQANLSYAQANAGYSQANAAYLQANAAYGKANAAYGQANAAYDAANNRVLKSGDTMTGILNVASTIISQNIIPNLSLTYDLGNTTNRFNDLYLGGNSVYIGDAILSTNGDSVRTNTFIAEVSFVSGGLNVLNQANSAYDAANNAGLNALNAYGQANAAYSQANSARTQANNAYAEANLKLNIAGGTVTGSLNVTGNLYISGNTTYYNVTTYIVDDPLIYLAANNDQTDLVDIGFIGGKNTGGVYSHTGLARDASDATWYLFDNLPDEAHENNVINFANTSLATLRANINANSILLVGQPVATQANLTVSHDQANSARDQANTARDTANGAYGQANGAYGQANGAYSQANGAYTQANGAYAQANGAYNQANGAYTQANGAYSQANSSANTVRVYANSAGELSNKFLNFINTSSIQVTVTDNLDGNANISFNTTGAAVADAYAQANSARNQANTARDVANGAYGQANTARTTANDSYGQANTARDQANTARDQANTARTQANTSYAQANSSYSQANLSYAQANAAYNQANAAYNDSNTRVLKSGDTMTGALTITTSGIGLNVANANITGNLNVGTQIVTGGSSGDISGVNTIYAGTFSTGTINVTAQAANAYDQANNARNQANTGYGQANTARTTANDAYAQANTARTTANDAYGQANTARDQANAARTQANTAYGQANDAYTQANTARNIANSSYAQANSAANTVRVSVNGIDSLGPKQLNFVDTGSVTVTVTDSGNGNASIQFASLGSQDYSYNTTTTSIETVDSWAANTYRSGKYQMQVSSSLGYLACEIMMIHNGASANMIQFGNVSLTNNSLGIFTTDISGGLIRLRFTASDLTTRLRYYRSLVKNDPGFDPEVLPTDLMTGAETYDLMLDLYIIPTDLNA